MPPKAKAAPAASSVFVVVTSNGIDSVYATGASANERSDVLKADAADPSTIKVELHNVKADEEKPAAKAAPAPAAKATTAAKTKSVEEQRVAIVEKAGKPADDDLPDNVKALLAGSGDVLSGKIIVVTGVPPTLKRKNAERLVTSYGGKLTKSLSKNTSFVVVGNDAGPTKLEKIEELGIEVLDEDEFVAMLESGGGGGGGSKRAADENEKPAKAKRQKK